jgi:hypothetical protein
MKDNKAYFWAKREAMETEVKCKSEKTFSKAQGPKGDERGWKEGCREEEAWTWTHQ